MQSSPRAMSESSTFRRTTSSKDFPKRSVMAPSSPFKSSSKDALPEGIHRLYKAPLALVRRSSIHDAPKPKPKTGNTRRRRRPSIPLVSNEVQGTGFVRQLSSSSLIDTMVRPPSAPPVWQGDSELGASVPEYGQRTPPRFRRSSHLHMSHGYDDSEYLDEDSHSHIQESHSSGFHSHYGVEEGSFFRRHKGPYFSNILQLIIILVLGVIVYDSNHKNTMHKAQLQQYDEERSHILEQMMWIDKAAKKVHKKYTNESLLKDIEAAEPLGGDLRQDVEGLRDEMEELQRRIQLNARDRINERFGDKPMQVSLSLDTEGSRHVSVALSDDTPHAAGIWLQQIDKKMWNDVIFEKTADSVQISTRMPNTSPLLEFVEKSRRCREIGSVAVRQLENMELHVLVLRIALKEDTPMDESDVCIGRVVGGLDELRLLPQTVQHEASSIPL